MTDVPPEPGSIIDHLERDHLVIRGLLERFEAAATHEWGELFRDLVDFLVRHETAEEEVVFPALEKRAPGSESVVGDCVAEQQKTRLRLVEMERMSPMAPEFRDALGHLRDDLGNHIAHEELVIIPMIRSINSQDDAALASRYEVARTTAPRR